MAYAALGEVFAKELAGRLNACLTLSWMLGGFVVQNAYGLVLDGFPSSDGAYAPEGHRLGMGMLLAVLLAALAWFLFASILLARRRAAADSGTQR